MALNQNKANTTKVPVDVFIAERTVENTAVTPLSLAESRANGSVTWKCVGGMKEGFPHVVVNPLSIMDQAGRPAQTGVDTTIDIDGFETTYAQLQTLDGFVNKLVDVIAVEQGGTTGHRYQKVGITVGYDGKFTRKDANIVKIKMQASNGKLTDAYDQVTLS